MRNVVALSLALAFLGATIGGAAKPFPAALADVLVRDPDVAPCYESAHAASSVAYASANFDMSNVTLRNGKRMVVVTGGGSCVCGNANCKVAVFEQIGDTYHPALSDYGIDWKVRPDGTAVVTSHDSAAVVYRTSYRWETNAYAVTGRDMIYVPTDSVKPVSRVVTFAPGTSSTTIHGNRVTLGFEDTWTLAGRAGQTLTLTVMQSDRHFGSVSVRDAGGTIATSNHGTLRITLPRPGKYEIAIDGADESFATYVIRVSIR